MGLGFKVGLDCSTQVESLFEGLVVMEIRMPARAKGGSIMKIGFTGTRKGMSAVQKVEVRGLVREMFKTLDTNFQFHHGDCVGADAEFHEIVSDFQPSVIVIHPPINPRARAFCCSKHIMPEKPYLNRNRDIVDACDVLIAAPKSTREELRSGTWTTVRYARKRGKPIKFAY